eukprot:10048-Heterococcus_DN1.PRE.2
MPFIASPLQRVHEILQRIQCAYSKQLETLLLTVASLLVVRSPQTNPDNVECLKTCCGALAILAKDEGNKLIIVRDGVRLILALMEAHAAKVSTEDTLKVMLSTVYALLSADRRRALDTAA